MPEHEVILITGANRGIGLGVAREFERNGWRVFGGCREIPAGGDSGGIEWVVLDVADDSSVKKALSGIGSRVPHLDVLVNNAGINPEPHDAGVLDIPVEVVLRAFNVNTAGALRVLQASAALLRLSHYPRVVNVSSGAGSLAHNRVEKRLPAYCISKAALNMFTQRAARELTDMTVVSVTPGWVRTDMGGSDASLGVDEVCEALAKTITALNRSRSGEWIDRFGKTSEFSWRSSYEEHRAFPSLSCGRRVCPGVGSRAAVRSAGAGGRARDKRGGVQAVRRSRARRGRAPARRAGSDRRCRDAQAPPLHPRAPRAPLR